MRGKYKSDPVWSVLSGPRDLGTKEVEGGHVRVLLEAVREPKDLIFA
jgi:hypothetical protein